MEVIAEVDHNAAEGSNVVRQFLDNHLDEVRDEMHSITKAVCLFSQSLLHTNES